MATPEAVLPREEAMAHRLTELLDYGPVRIKTREADIPGIEYRRALGGDPDQRPYAVIGSNALSFAQDGEEVQVTVQADETHDPVVLHSGQIEGASIDHPHGSDMPLHGKSMMAVGITNRDGISVLRWPDHVIEHGWRHTIEMSVHDLHAGISVAKLYSADRRNNEDRGATLEEAKAMDENPGIILMSQVNERTFVATSRLGYRKTRVVTVRPPKHPDNAEIPLRHIEMIDMTHEATYKELVHGHIARFRDLSQDPFVEPRWPMSRMAADALFLYMVND